MILSTKTKSFELKYTESDTLQVPLLESHCHFRFEMIAVISGSIDILIEGCSYRCGKGEVTVIPPLTYHSVRVSEVGYYRRITALFEPDILPQEIMERLCTNLKSSPIFSSASLPLLSENLQLTICKDNKSAYSPLAEAISLQILYDCAEEKPPEHRNNGVQGGDTLEKAIKYIDQHITEKIVLEDVAQAAFVSLSSLCHIFSKRMQISPKQYIIQKKIAYATMLIEGGMPITQAARAVGYDNYSNFYRMRKKF